MVPLQCQGTTSCSPCGAGTANQRLSLERPAPKIGSLISCPTTTSPLSSPNCTARDMPSVRCQVPGSSFINQSGDEQPNEAAEMVLLKAGREVPLIRAFLVSMGKKTIYIYILKRTKAYKLLKLGTYILIFPGKMWIIMQLHQL